ncbi:Glutaconate CoA-transferase subunit B [subsurface metagenome]
MSTKATPYEVMAAAISHELNDLETWFIGLATGETTILLLSRVPLAGMALAQHTHAPNSFIFAAGWLLKSEFGNILWDWRCECRGNALIPPYSADRGEMDVGFGSAAQIDKYGNCNIVCIGDYYKPKVRLIGPINQPGHFALFGREFIVCDHERRNFVDKVDFISGVGYLDGPGAREKLGLIGGGPCLILTDKAIFDFDPETKLARLRSIHPGVSLEDVIANTGFTHDYVPQHVAETPPPTDEELRLLREVIDPRGVLLPRE